MKNKIFYTQSPGGIRRGLIWQSSNNILQVDPRQYIYTPFFAANSPSSYAHLPGQSIQTPNNGYPISGTSYRGLIQYRPIIFNRNDFVCQLYPYRTTIGTDINGDNFISIYSDEQTYLCEVDAFISPSMVHGDSADLEPSASNYSGPWSNIMQLTSGGVPKNIAYYQDSPGEWLGGIINNVAQQLEQIRISYPSAPMRIKGYFLYSDYPFTLSNIATGGYSQARLIDFPWDLITNNFINILDARSFPTDNDFSGCGMYSQEKGNYYNNFGVPAFQNNYGSRIDKPNSNDAITKSYRYTSGVLYDGLNKDYQLFLSPLLFPAVSTSFTDDTYFWLPPIATTLDFSDYSKHASIGIIPPMIIMPEIATCYNPGGGNAVQITYNNRHFVFNQGNFTHSGLYAPYPFMCGMTGSGYIERSALGAVGMTGPSSTQSAGPTPTSIIVDPSKMYGTRDYWQHGAVQPSLEMGQKYIQEIKTIVAKCDSFVNDSSGQYRGAYCGRYKFLGFKGKISFFEI